MKRKTLNIDKELTPEEIEKLIEEGLRDVIP
jgi:hypothetical protein